MPTKVSKMNFQNQHFAKEQGQEFANAALNNTKPQPRKGGAKAPGSARRRTFIKKNDDRKENHSTYQGGGNPHSRPQQQQRRPRQYTNNTLVNASVLSEMHRMRGELDAYQARLHDMQEEKRQEAEVPIKKPDNPDQVVIDVDKPELPSVSVQQEVTCVRYRARLQKPVTSRVVVRILTFCVICYLIFYMIHVLSETDDGGFSGRLGSLLTLLGVLLYIKSSAYFRRPVYDQELAEVPRVYNFHDLKAKVVDVDRGVDRSIVGELCRRIQRQWTDIYTIEPVAGMRVDGSVDRRPYNHRAAKQFEDRVDLTVGCLTTPQFSRGIVYCEELVDSLVQQNIGKSPVDASVSMLRVAQYCANLSIPPTLSHLYADSVQVALFRLQYSNVACNATELTSCI